MPDPSERPWGSYKVLLKDANVQVKRIEVKPGMRFSLQKHMRRAEKWIVTAGEGVVTLGNRQIPVQRGSFVDVPLEEVHRMHNTGPAPLVFVEVQLGDYLEEDDIVRLEDDFQRK
jgi:mannose-6-phosphate isomerase